MHVAENVTDYRRNHIIQMSPNITIEYELMTYPWFKHSVVGRLIENGGRIHPILFRLPRSAIQGHKEAFPSLSSSPSIEGDEPACSSPFWAPIRKFPAYIYAISIKFSKTKVKSLSR